MKGKKLIGLGVAAAFVLSLFSAPATLAWGPKRPTYTMAAPAQHATFNSIIDNELVGNEQDFVRIVEDGAGKELNYGDKVNENIYVSELTIEPGKRYRVYIYYHNDASETYNYSDHNQVGIAKDVRLATNFPDQLNKYERQAIFAKITSSTTDPESVWDEAYVTAKEALTLHYVQGSAKIYNHWFPTGEYLTVSNLFSDAGVLIGTSAMNGLIPGCDRFSGSVSYVIETKAVEKPVNPDPDPEPTPDPDPEPEPTPDPEPEPEPTPDPLPTPEPTPDPTPSELPNTGPIEIGLAVVLLLVIVAGVAYWSKTRHQVSKATRKAKGKK